jgi:L-threonylcarbamoyladenylate synthase
VLSIFRIKNRPDFDPLIVHTHSLEEAQKWISAFPEKAKRLAEKFWPGPLTLVLPKAPEIPYEVTSGLDTVGIRVPDHPLTLELLRTLDFPLAAPSANPFGYVSPTTAKHVADQLGNQVPYILDGGPCRVGIESTIVGFENEIPVILRKGMITAEMIEAVTGKTETQLFSQSNPKAPGMLLSHYAPHTPVELAAKAANIDPQRTGYIGFAIRHPGIPVTHQQVLSSNGDLFEAARTLYAALRKLDQMNLEKIYIEMVPEQGIGTAVNDRIRRAVQKRD